jgi:GTPase
VFSTELAAHLSAISRDIGRQVGVLIEREGAIRHVVVGSATRLMLPDVGRLRGGAGRFRGLRLVHTHLRGEPLTHDDFNDLALLRLDLVAMIEARADGSPGAVEVAHLVPGREVAPESPDGPFRRVRAADVHALQFDLHATMAALEREMTRLEAGRPGEIGPERALVIGAVSDEDRFDELLDLVRASGVTVAGTLRQRRAQVHPRTVLGPGRLEEIVLEGMQRAADVAIFDLELKPAQARAFEDATGLKAIDRTQLILDIFAQRAHSRDGRLQVELAQLKYSLPRLTEKDAGLSRLSGGIGGRGPGETTMEIGRRRIRDRIRALEQQVDRLARERHLRRSRRRDVRLPVVGLVGYTNVGKSTLLNALTKADVAVADKMFMTLDPTSRRLRFPRQGEVVITDTVGFMTDLPRDLVAAFRATLEELQDAHVLLHVMDAADLRLDQKHQAVEGILQELQLDEIPRIAVLNKVDRLPHAEVQALARRYAAVPISAASREGLDRVMEAVEDVLGGIRRPGEGDSARAF